MCVYIYTYFVCMHVPVYVCTYARMYVRVCVTHTSCQRLSAWERPSRAWLRWLRAWPSVAGKSLGGFSWENPL